MKGQIIKMLILSAVFIGCLKVRTTNINDASVPDKKVDKLETVDSARYLLLQERDMLLKEIQETERELDSLRNTIHL